MVDVSPLKRMGKKAYHWAEPKIIWLPYGDRILEGISSLGFAGIYTFHFLEGTDMTTSARSRRHGKAGSKHVTREEIKGYIDSLLEGTEERILLRLDERGNKLQAENSVLTTALEGARREMGEIFEEFQVYKADQQEKGERNTAAFRATEGELERLRGSLSELENSNRILQEDTADAARALERKDEELKSIRGNKYSFDISIPITEMELGGSSMYPMTEKNVIYDFAAWIQKANEADLPREYMNRILKLLEHGGSLPRKPRRKAFLAMLEGDPKDAMKILNSHKICPP